MNNSLPCTRIRSTRLKEEYRLYHHPSGLDIYVFPKEMTNTYALFGTKYGSIHNTFFSATTGEMVTVPDGIAHFLEHKLFTCEDGSDAFERFSDYGADANAYTSFNKTCYLFSCTDRFEDSLKELLEFVTHPYFTPESVESEVGIISEEIRMYDDNPSDRCFYGMLEAMYQFHSIRRNICGSVESISQITADLLYQCYHTFYRLSNMALVVCGNVSDETVLRIADQVLPSSHAEAEAPIQCFNENEQERRQAFQPYVEYSMQVSKPIFNIGFKDTEIPAEGAQRQRKDAAMSILNEMLFSRAGELYNFLIETDLISPALSYGYSISETTAYNSVAGESDDPQAVLKEIQNYLQKVRKSGLSQEAFELGKRVMYAEFVKSFDSTESIANNLFAFVCEDSELLSYLDTLEQVTFDEVCELFQSAFLPETTAMCVVLPLENTAK
ncbi:MAG: insulinase family protein [Clostridia bacterium]|nr:insulinase family protein [Clostridia bacterium]